MNKQQNLENFQKLVSKEKSGLLEKLKWEKENEQWLDHSFQIALNVVRAMRKQNLNQKDLAQLMQVTPQYISKMLKGKENLSLQTISKLEEVLAIKLITIAQSNPQTEGKIKFNMEFNMDLDFGMKELKESINYPQISISNFELPSVEKSNQSIYSKLIEYLIDRKNQPFSTAKDTDGLYSVAA